MLHYIEWCRQSFRMKGLVNFYLGDNSVPMVHLTHPNGSTASVYLHGANVTSWTSPDGDELLHVREQPSDAAIRYLDLSQPITPPPPSNDLLLVSVLVSIAEGQVIYVVIVNHAYMVHL